MRVSDANVEFLGKANLDSILIQELKVPTPTEPEVFLKSMLSVTGPFDPVRRGQNPGVKLDWEVELAIVIDI